MREGKIWKLRKEIKRKYEWYDGRFLYSILAVQSAAHSSLLIVLRALILGFSAATIGVNIAKVGLTISSPFFRFERFNSVHISNTMFVVKDMNFWITL